MIAPPRATASAAAALEVVDVSMAFGATLALDAVSLTVASGTVHGLVGGNGSGKSTLIKILAGVHRGAGGTVSVHGDRRLAAGVDPAWAADTGLRFVHQDLAVFGNLTVAENLALGSGYASARGGRIAWRQVRRRAETLLDRYDIEASPDQPLQDLRPADRTLVAIARALQDQAGSEGRVLVLDEPTVCLPLPDADRLLAALRGYADAGLAILYVSHRLEEIVRIADAATVLRDGRRVAELTAGNDLTEDRLVTLIAGPDVVNPAATPGVDQPFTSAPVLEVDGLQTGGLRDVTFELHPGEVVGLAGLVGSGRSRLLRTLFGVHEPQAGGVALDGRSLELRDVRDAVEQGIAYVSEDRARDSAFAGLSVRHNFTGARVNGYWRRGRLRHREEGADATAALLRFRVQALSERQPLGTLSGGNQQKVILGRWLRHQPRVMLLDEPTQGVDVGARAEIHALIREAVSGGGAALMASSDFEELAVHCDRVLVLVGGRIGAELRRPDLTVDRMTELAFRSDREAA